MKKTVCRLVASLLLLTLLAGCTAGADSGGTQSAPAGYRDPLSVEVTGGVIKGAEEDGVHVFKGIPFAAPPLGELRFAPPQPVVPWEGVLDCTYFRDMPVQTASELGLTYGEDCLTLNIWAPGDAAGKELPVLVYIHGGAFSQGAAGKSMYKGTRFARDGVIQVNIGYRLNALGFLASEEVADEYGVLGNAGVLDQIAALEWIRENIAAFGGDAGNVTICGESAGAFSVSNLILSPRAEGLFSKAIMESGNVLGQPIVAPTASGDVAQALAAGDTLLESLDVPDIAGLREVDAQTIANGSAFIMNMSTPSALSFWPVFDGQVIPEDPYEALVEGKHNGVDILAGFNTDEGTLFIPEGLTEADYKKFLATIFGERAAEVERRLPVDARHTPTQRARYIVLMGLRFGSDVFADELARQGHKAYFYHFDLDLPVLDEVGYGTGHAMELPFVFDTLPAEFVLGDEVVDFKEAMHGYWLNFVETGDPNRGSHGAAVTWPEYTEGEKDILVLAGEITPSTAPDTEDVEFFRDLLWG